MNFSYIGLLFLVIFIHLTTITSVAAGKRSFGNKNSPAGLLLFAQTFPKSCSYPTFRAEMQMKEAGQVLTGSWRREGPEVLLSQAGIPWPTSKH